MSSTLLSSYSFARPHGIASAFVHHMTILDASDQEKATIPVGQPWKIRLYVVVCEPIDSLVVGLGMRNQRGIAIRTSWTEPFNAKTGKYRITFNEDQVMLCPGLYELQVGLSVGGRTVLQYMADAGRMEIAPYTDGIALVTLSSGLIANQMKTDVAQVPDDGR